MAPVRQSLTLLLFTLVALAIGQQKAIQYSIREEQDTGTYVGNVARDSEIFRQFNQTQFENLQYSIPVTVSKFKIDSKTSTIHTAERLDRENECEGVSPDQTCMVAFGVSVFRVNSDSSFHLLMIINVEIMFEDVNDNAPRFPSNETTLDVPESVEVGQVLRTSGAIDRDSGANNTVQTYTLKGGNGMFKLRVYKHTGGSSTDLGLVLLKKLNREVTSFYKLKIIAEDGGFPKLSGTVDILVNVVDVNDNTPMFVETSFAKTVKEDARVGSTIITLSAYDPDELQNGRLTYSFSSLTPSKVLKHFDLNATSGEISLKNHLDYEKDKSFLFTAIVSDHGSPAKSSETSVNITVEDVNDNAPQIEVTLPSANLKESIGVGNYIAHVSLSDLDSSKHSVVSCSVSNDHFRMQKFTGSDTIFTVLLERSLDYEKSHTEVVNVTCNDGGQPALYNTSSFVIHVQDVNDNAPVFTRNEYRYLIEENNYIGQFVAQIQAIDPDQGDNGNVSYSLVVNPGNHFRVNPNSGVIKSMTRLDKETASTYNLVVMARDRGVPPISSSVTVTVSVIDVNDNPPYFTKPHFDFRVQENKPRHTVVDTLFAHDPDMETENHLRFEFTQNYNFSDIFAIDRMSGIIYTLTKLDRETRSSYSFDVRVFDESQPRFSDVTKVTITVTDDNDIQPNITFPPEFNNTFHILYTLPVGSVVLTVEAEDGDAGENGTVTYTIAKSNQDGLFFINSMKGELMVAKRMSIYDSGTYKLLIRARDSASSYLESTREINVVVSVANGTVGFMNNDDGDNTNIAIVIALICVTLVLAMAVLITICIIRRIDRERKHHTSAKVEEENIYKQRVVPETVDMGTPVKRLDKYENEVDRMKKKIKADMSFPVEDDSNPLDMSNLSNKSSFSTFRDSTGTSLDQKILSTPQAHSSVLQNTLSPTEKNAKRVHYLDKGLDIDRLTTTSPPPRGQPGTASTSSYQGGKSSQWGRNSPRTSNPTPEDAASHSSGSTSDSGRGGSSEEGEGQGHTTPGVALGDSEAAGRPLHSYPTCGQLMTFGSPNRSTASSSGTSHMPRSLSSSSNATSSKQRLWSEPTSSSGPSANTSLSSCQPVTLNPGPKVQSHAMAPTSRALVGVQETAEPLKPNISFSDDSVNANATLWNPNRQSLRSRPAQIKATQAGDPVRVPSTSSQPSNLLSTAARSVDALSRPANNLASTSRPRIGSSNSPFRLAGPDVSNIPADPSSRHGAFIEGSNSSLIDPSWSSRPARSYGNAYRAPRGNAPIDSFRRHPNRDQFKAGTLSRGHSCENNVTQGTVAGEPYSLADVDDVLDDSRQVGSSHSRMDDDNTTTTSGSYTINADDLCQEIDQLFFKDIVV